MFVLATEYLQFGANLFFWIVAILIGLIAAASFLDFQKVQGPQAPHHEPEDHTPYWESRKHAEAVHQEFKKEKVISSKDPITGKP